MKRIHFTILIITFVLALVLRFYKISEIPPSLYWDEASLGYNAFSILKTGKDEHGNRFPITNFPAFGDYKPPGYIYSAAVSIAIFDLSEFAIRFPSALSGSLTILITFLLANKLFKNRRTAILSAFFLAVSIWHIQHSRAAFEANLALFFSSCGIYFFVKFAKDRKFWLLPSSIFFLFALYTFTGQRLFIPLILTVLLIQFRNEIAKNKIWVLIVALISFLLFWPLLLFSTHTIEGQLRFKEVSIFQDLNPINDSTAYREEDSFAKFSSLIHNRRLFYFHEYLKHYFDAFDPSFLFTKGDVNPRLSIQKIGELYLFDLPLILTGIYFLLKNRFEYSFLIFGWLLVSPLGPATARETPHALRMIYILPTFQMLSSYGLINLLTRAKYQRILVGISCLIFLCFFSYYLHLYYFLWPKSYSGEWQYGYKEAVKQAETHYNDVDKIYVTKYQGRPYVYFLLYMKFDPSRFQNDSEVIKDQFFFLDVNRFDKFNFISEIPTINKDEKELYILAPNTLPSNAQKISSIKNLEGREVFDVGISKQK